MKIQDYINGPVTYDKFGGQYLWINEPDGGIQMLAMLRGWGRIQHLFKKEEDAAKFQDEVGDWIAEAINEKLERDKQSEATRDKYKPFL